MISAFLGFVSLVAVPALAQSIYVYPTAATAPRGSYQTVTAIVTGVNNKTVTWTTDGGAIVGTNPCVVNEPCTVALYATSTGTYHLTATSNANGAVSATSTITITGSPTPVTTHPRLYITQSMVTGLKAKFTAGSTMATNLHTGNGGPYTDAYGGVTWYNDLKAAPFNWSFTCEGGTGLPAGGTAGNYLEQASYTFALLALVDPNTSTGTNWGCYGHDVWTYLENLMVSGGFAPSLDGWRDDAYEYIFTADWLIGSGALSSSGDLTLARQYVAWMLKYTWTSNYSNFLPPTASTGYNSSSVLGQLDKMRYLGNNYDEAAFFYLAALPLTFNDNTTDDPPLANTCSATRYQVCSDGTAGSMHAYGMGAPGNPGYFDGALLYDQYAIMEDPNVGWQAYQAAYANLPTQPVCYWSVPSTNVPCFGEQRGGEPAEGSGYGYNVYSIRWGLNAIYTAGYADPTIYGPQISLPFSSWWDMRDVVSNEFLTGFKPENGNYLEPSGGIQPAYAYLHTGDAKHYYASPLDYLTETGMLVFDTYTGRTDRTNALLWPVLNAAFGGPAGTSGGCNTYCGFDYSISSDNADSLNPDLFIALAAVDPGTLTPTDPRPSMPTDLYNGSFNQHSDGALRIHQQRHVALVLLRKLAALPMSGRRAACSRSTRTMSTSPKDA